jgi:hypothetical protein
MPERYRVALEWAVRLHRNRFWPGTRIPRLASVLEVACRVAAWGGEEDEVTAALLHALPPGHCPEAFLAEVGATFGPGVATILGAGRRGGWFLGEDIGTWSVGSGELPREARLLVTCATLVHLRCILLDWWYLAEHLQGNPAPNRQGLCTFYRSWFHLPAPDADAPPTGYPALDLAYGPAWDRLVKDSHLVERTIGWGLPVLAAELSTLLEDLPSAVGGAVSGFLLASWRERLMQDREGVALVARECNLTELMEVLRFSTSCSFRAPLVERLPEAVQIALRRHKDYLACPSNTADGRALVRALSVLVHEGSVVFPPLGGVCLEEVAQEMAEDSSFPEAVLTAAQLLEGEVVPFTTIPSLFPVLEEACLTLSEGTDCHTTLLSIGRNPLSGFPVTARPGDPATGPANRTVLRWLLADFAALGRGPAGFPPSPRKQLQEAFWALTAIDGRKGWKDVAHRLLAPIRIDTELPPWLTVFHDSWRRRYLKQELPGFRNECGFLASLLTDFVWEEELAWHRSHPWVLEALNDRGIDELLVRIDPADLAPAFHDSVWVRVKAVLLRRIPRGQAAILRDEIEYLKPDAEATRKSQLAILGILQILREEGLIKI